MLKRVDDDELIATAKLSNSAADLLQNIGYANSGKNLISLRKRLELAGISDEKFFKSFQRLRGQKTTATDEEVFCKDSKYYNSRGLKERLVKGGYLEYACSEPECMIKDEWLGKKITLHLDHINGDNRDNRIENLRFLCPNCHTQTETYCRGTRPAVNRVCECGKPKTYKAKMCRACKDKNQAAIDYPPVEEVIAMVEKAGTYAAVGAQLGVSGTQISQYIKSRSKQ